MKFLRKLFFTIWYFKNPPWDTNITPPELYEFISHHPPGRAVDLGCGTGTNVITLARHGWQAVGVDYVRKAIRSARQKARHEAVRAEFRVGDVAHLDWVTQPFDLVLDIGCLHSLDPAKRQKYIQNLRKILAPGGKFLLYAFVKAPDSDSAGLTNADLGMISAVLDLLRREDGMDGGRNSGWFTFQKLPQPLEEI